MIAANRRSVRALELMSPACLISKEHKILRANRAFERLYPRSVGQSCHKHLARTDGPCESCPLPKVLVGCSLRRELWNAASGEKRSLRFSPLPLGRTQLMLAVMEPPQVKTASALTERHLIEFVHRFCTELRTPLSAMLEHTKVLSHEDRLYLDAMHSSSLQYLEQQARWSMRALDGLLAVVRCLDRQEIHESYGSIEVLHELLEAFRDILGNRPVVVFEGSLPRTDIPRPMLTQILQSLLSNAIRHGGGVCGAIEFGGRTYSDRIRLYCRDHGRGIPERERQRVFEMRPRNGAEKGAGDGMGLPLAKQIARLCGGDAWIEETAGGGTTVWVELAAFTSSQAPPQTPMKLPSRGPATRAFCCA